MPKPPAYDLSDAEKRDLAELIRSGQPLPEKYRFILFADKREVELVWNGKTRDVCTTVLPFQTLEHVDEPRAETKTQFEMFDARGRQIQGWTNKLIWGDNKLILSSLKAGALRRQIEDAGGLKLIYIDPPFDVGADFSMDIEIGGETFHKEPNLLEQIAYRDTWGRGADSFIAMIYERLILMRDLLAEDGSIYVHCDWRVNAFIRLAMDEVFGRQHFINEITWKRAHTVKGNMGQGSKFMGANTDTVFAYAKTPAYTFHTVFLPYTDEYLNQFYRFADEKTGRRYRLISMIGPGGVAKGNPVYEVMGITRPWRYSQHKMQELVDAGEVVQTNPGTVPQRKQYLDDGSGVAVQTLWDNVTGIGASSGENTNYPTQKPEALLERIIKASSNAGDLVADFFTGSGTTAAMAEKLGRKWIATDLGKFAIHTTRKRLIGVQRELKAAEKNFRAFEVLNLGRYERQAYLDVHFSLDRHSRAGGNPALDENNEKLDARLRGHDGKRRGDDEEVVGNDGKLLSRAEIRERLLQQKEREFRELILRAYKAEALANDAFFDGRFGPRLVVIGPINLPVGRLFVEEVIMQCRKRGATRCDVLAFEFEMGLFPAVLEEAKGKGIDLTPKYIPAEVFDKRAVDKGQVVFHDISFVEATPRYAKGKSAKDKLTLKIELTDFSVYYTQGAAEAALANLKDGKSNVICEQGRLIKLSKDKAGVVTREVLTKAWTDWVDYWAVDFDYQSRREIIKVPKDFVIPAQAGIHGMGEELDPRLRGDDGKERGDVDEFEERWTGGYIFENEWQSFRTRKQRELELVTAEHVYDQPGRYTVAVKVIDIFGNDTMTLVPVNVG